MAYHVTLAPVADKAVERLPKALRSRIAQRLESLSSNPRPAGSVKLAGRDAFRVRVGDYRVIYTIHDEQLIVLVIDIGHRREVYRRK